MDAMGVCGRIGPAVGSLCNWNQPHLLRRMSGGSTADATALAGQEREPASPEY